MIGLYEAVDAAKSGTRGALTLGGYIHQRITQGARMHKIRELFHAKGVDLPTDATLNKYASAYEAWVVNAQIPINAEFRHPSWTDDAGERIIFGLGSVSVYKLYEARNLIDRNEPLETLMWCAQTPIDDVRDEAANRGLSDAARVRSLPKVAEGDFEVIRGTHELARRVDPGLSRGDWLVLMSQFFGDMAERDVAAFEAVVRGYAGVESDEAR